MRRAFVLVLGIGLATHAGGCGSPQSKSDPGGAGSGGGSPAPATSAGAGAGGGGSASGTVDVRMRVGHYRSSDGVLAFHLDRSSDQVAKLRYDGSNETVELAPQQGPSGRIDYLRKGQGVVLHVYTDGRVVAYHKDRPDGVDVRRDDLETACREPCREKPVKKDQSVEVKMRLGHYASADGVMGFVLDRRDDKVAKLRYDGSKETVELSPQQGPSGRIDYVRKGQGVVLHYYPGGRVVIYHKDRPDGVHVARDGDADPL